MNNKGLKMHHRAKLSDEQVRQMRDARERLKLPYSAIGKLVNCPLWTARDICTYAHPKERPMTLQRVLTSLEADSPQTVNALHEALGISKSVITKLARTLYESGQVNRREGLSGYEYSACNRPPHPIVRWGLEVRP